MFLPLIFITILSIIIILTTLTKHIINNNAPKSPHIKHPPGPQGLPFIGNLHQIKPLATHLYFTQLSKTYGPIFHLKLGSIPAIVVSSPKLAKEILKNQDHVFCGRRLLTAQRKLSYGGSDVVFSNYNRSWRELRKICIIHMFSTRRVRSYSSIRREEVIWVLNEVSTLSSGSSKVVNLSQLVVSMVISIVCRVGFGKRYKDDEKYKRGSEFYGMLSRSQLMFMSLFFSDYFPCIGWIDRVTGAMKKLQGVFHEFDEFYQELIDDHLDPNRGITDHEDIVDVLLRLQRDGDAGIEITLDHIKAVLMNVFIAGTETTIATIIWTMTYLMKNPNSMKKVQQELRSLIKQQKNCTTFIEEEHLQHLPYLQAVIKETHRINAIVPLSVPHQALQKCTLEGYNIDAGTLVFVNIWAIGRDPESWKDPDVFFPERFLDSDMDFKGKDFEFIPFGAGRRICPGMLMGNVTIELALANILCWFNWEVIDGMTRDDIDIDVLAGITVAKKNDLCLSAKNVFI